MNKITKPARHNIKHKTLKFNILLAALIVLLIMEIQKIISPELFMYSTSLSFVIYIINSFGIDSISELALGKLSIKRDIQKAEKILYRISLMQERINEITKLNTENSYIIASESMLAMKGDSLAKNRLENNIDMLVKLAGNDIKRWNEVEKMFDYRKDN